MERDCKAECARLEEIIADRTKDIVYYDRELKTANQALEKMQSQLQQVEEREARYREALEEIEARCVVRADEDDTHFENLHEARQALFSPSQPSKYEKMVAVVDIARELNKNTIIDHDIEQAICPIPEIIINLDDALTALDAEGEK